jgi:hypothetical protein
VAEALYVVSISDEGTAWVNKPDTPIVNDLVPPGPCSSSLSFCLEAPISSPEYNQVEWTVNGCQTWIMRSDTEGQLVD